MPPSKQQLKLKPQIPFSEDALRTFFLPRVLHGLDDVADVDADVLATLLLVSASWAEPYNPQLFPAW